MDNFCVKVSPWDWKKYMRNENYQRKQCLRGSTKTCQIWEIAVDFFHLFQTMASNGPKCSICLECYNDEDKCPRMLNCGHSFCSSCLNRLLHGNTIHCPTCRNPVAVPTGVQGLAKNFALLEIVNEASREQVVLCPKHKEPFRFFDEDCGIVICRDCHALYHSGHNCVEVAEAASKYRQEMEALVTKASSQAEKIKAAEALVGRASVSMKESCEEQRAELLGFFGEVSHVFVIGSTNSTKQELFPFYKNH